MAKKTKEELVLEALENAKREYACVDARLESARDHVISLEKELAARQYDVAMFERNLKG